MGSVYYVLSAWVFCNCGQLLKLKKSKIEKQNVGLDIFV